MDGRSGGSADEKGSGHASRRHLLAYLFHPVQGRGDESADTDDIGTYLSSLFQGHDDILIDVSFLHLDNSIIGSGRNLLTIVMDNGNFTESTSQEEIGDGLPGQTLTHSLILACLRGAI